MKVIATIRQFKTEQQSEALERINKIYETGIKNYRVSLVDFSEGTIISNMDLCKRIKNAHCDVNIFIDLSFPYHKARVIETKNNVPFSIKTGETIFLYPENATKCENEYIKVNVPNLNCFDEMITYSDGEGKFKIVNRNEDRLVIEACNDIKIYNRSSLISKEMLFSDISIAQLNLLHSYLDDLQIKNLFFSFVSNVQDITRCDTLFKKYNIIPKIETCEGVNNINEIVNCTDGIFLARGDLGLNVPIADFKQSCNIVMQAAKKSHNITVLGTDVLSSLSYRNFPSRSDIVDMAEIASYDPDYVVLNGSVVKSPNLSYACNIIDEFSKFVNA